ncbi:MAG: hypothetical protein ACRD3V_34335 [Vicinamibacteria bacterium]
MSPLDGTLEVKCFLSEEAAAKLSPRDFVPIFHEWIRSDRLPEETLIDVADYSHLRGGPGVVLVGHRAAYGLDAVAGRLGLSYRLGPSAAESRMPRLELALFRALRACRALEEEGPRGIVRFRTDEVRLRFLDRLRAPRARQTRAAALAETAPFFERIFSGARSLEIRDLSPVGDGEPLGLVIETAPPPPLGILLARVSRDGRGTSAAED